MHPSALRRTADWTLANGSKIPKIGLGTWKAQQGQVGPAVSHALKTGYRHLDLAWAYRNEDEIGEAIRKANVNRKDLWLTSKLWNSFHAPENVEKGLDASLHDLGVDYLDLYLIHWPVAFLNKSGEQVASHKGENGKPVEEVELSRNIQPTWEAMERLVKKGKVRNIGISNFNIRRSEELLKSSSIKPVVNQVEVNWGCPNESLLQWSEANGIKLEGYSPLGSSSNVARYLKDPVVAEVAARNNITSAQVFIAWTLGRGIISLPKSVSPERIKDNFKVMDIELPQADVEYLTKEALKRPLERTVDPRESWGTADDIFEDNIDPQRHQSQGTGASSGSRSYHTSSTGRNRGSPRSTALQQQLNVRAFGSTSRVRAATAEVKPPSTSEAPAVASSTLLRTNTKTSLATPGLTWTDGEEGVQRETRKINMYTAIRDAQSHALGSDDTACVFGEDVAFGGVFRSTMGLAEEFGKERVFNTPLTEQGLVGFGIGMASMGHTAIAEVQFADYIFPAFDQLVNEAAKYSYRSGGQHTAGGLTVRSPCMGVGHGALYHSQSVEQYFMPTPGLKVVIPRSPIQAKGLLLASIRDPNPVIFLEPKILYRSSVEHVPVDDFTLPLSSAEILQTGSDITLLSWGAPLYACEQAINMLRSPPKSIESNVPASVRDAKVELIDLRTILPWDRETVAKSVMKTGRCVIVHEAPVTAGAGAEISAHLQDRCFLRLEAPVCRIGGWDTPFPHVHETFYKPEMIRILDALVRTLQY